MAGQLLCRCCRGKSDVADPALPSEAASPRSPYDYSYCSSVPRDMKKPYTMGVLSRLIATCCAQHPPCTLQVRSDTNSRLLFRYYMDECGVETISVRAPQAERACQLSFTCPTPPRPGHLHTDFTWLAQFVSDSLAGVHTHLKVSLRYDGNVADDEEAQRKIRTVLTGEIASALAHDDPVHPIVEVKLTMPSGNGPGGYHTFTVRSK